MNNVEFGLARRYCKQPRCAVALFTGRRGDCAALRARRELPARAAQYHPRQDVRGPAERARVPAREHPAPHQGRAPQLVRPPAREHREAREEGPHAHGLCSAFAPELAAAEPARQEAVFLLPASDADGKRQCWQCEGARENDTGAGPAVSADSITFHVPTRGSGKLYSSELGVGGGTSSAPAAQAVERTGTATGSSLSCSPPK